MPYLNTKATALLILIFCLQNLSAQIMWDGGASTNLWSDAMNWDGDILPSNADDVEIGNGWTVEIPAGFNAVAQSIVLTSATMTIDATGTLTISSAGGSAGITVDESTVTNNGTVNISNCLDGILMRSPASEVTNGGNLNISDYASNGINMTNTGASCNSCNFNNNGSLSIDNGTSSTLSAISIGPTDATYSNGNSATLDIGQSANAGFGINFEFGGGEFINDGTVTIHNTGAGNVGIKVGFFTGTVRNNAGAIMNFENGLGDIWTGPFNLDFTNNGTVNIDKAGVVDAFIAGSGTFSGDEVFSFSHDILPGNSPGCMTFSSGYTMSQGGFAYPPSIKMEIGGTTACTDYDKVNVTGTANIDGSVSVSLINGFVPTGGQSFTIIEADNIIGSFDNVSYPVVANINWTTSYTATSVVANAISSLPVELTVFEAEQKSNIVELGWKTQSEIQNDGFLVEHSLDGSSWTQIGFVEGKGNSIDLNEYLFNHENPVGGINYYRLNQIDYDGTSNHSKVIGVEFLSEGGFSGPFAIYPNPVEDVLNLVSKTDEECLARVYDLNGKIVFEENVNQADSSFDLSKLASGIYVMNISNMMIIQSMRFIKR